ncbi:hypothetical protein AA0521_3388 [Komagataeibacter intermedius NRIC 0521]|uniref:Uncharacterized protein n=1 Tax=Komagataeibacter intermedius NRIC 0521 TaxID=1307934 RepID=A0ABQ0PS55_9PROT|nr:hypothetical protein AA0521_3388 [Komagataeibacter intermedius NRIC 0521]
MTGMVTCTTGGLSPHGAGGTLPVRSIGAGLMKGGLPRVTGSGGTRNGATPRTRATCGIRPALRGLPGPPGMGMVSPRMARATGRPGMTGRAMVTVA